MTTQPVLLLTFSNHADDYLPMIVAEQKAIKQALLDVGDKNYLEVRDVQHASTAEIFYLVNRYHQRLHIFHYGGHAGQESLQLEEEIGVVQTANARGIAGLLGTQQQLKLVFLNGCATFGQVRTLLDSGVPAVIATSVAIDDREAQQFAAQFYEAMAGGSTIAESYQKAKALIETLRKDVIIQDLTGSRGIKLDEAKPDASIPWGLYFSPEKENVLDWKLPTESPFEIDFSSDNWKRRPATVVNEILVDDSLRAICDSEIVRELARKIHAERKSGDPDRRPTDAEKKDAVVRAFPAPVSVHLRALFSRKLSQLYDQVRLQQLVTTYEKTLQFLAFILLSDLWDARYRKDQPLEMTEVEELQLRAFFDLNAFTVRAFDYFPLLDAMLKIAGRNSTSLYIEALQQYRSGWSGTPALQEIHAHFRRMDNELEKHIPDQLIETFGIASESHLTELLTELRFLVNYKMAVVKNIEVQQLKNMPPPAYKHIIVDLDNNYQDIGEKDRQQELQQPTDMESVLLYQQNLNQSLNLSPFILDENALIREYNSKMYFFSHRSEEGLYYRWIENDADTLLISQRRFPNVLLLFEQARRDILGENTHSKKAVEVNDEDILSLI